MQIDGWDVPVKPETLYKSSWLHWGSFLGSGKPKQMKSTLRRTPSDWLEIAIALAHMHNGLPGYAWLKNNGYVGLCSCITLHSKLFVDIPRQTPRYKYYSVAQWVKIAEDLALEHGGTLPAYKWLVLHDLNGLAHCMQHNPGEFQHIRRPSNLRQTLDDHLATAHELASQHGGKLPNVTSIMRNHPALYGAMQRHPSSFQKFVLKRFYE